MQSRFAAVSFSSVRPTFRWAKPCSVGRSTRRMTPAVMIDISRAVISSTSRKAGQDAASRLATSSRSLPVNWPLRARVMNWGPSVAIITRAISRMPPK